MTKRGTAAAIAFTIAAVALSGFAHAKSVATVEEALALTFGEGVTITPEVYELTAEMLISLEEQHKHTLLTADEKKSWGCPLAEDYEEAMAELKELEYQPTTSFEFFHASKDGENLGSAVIVDAPGKWGMVDYLVGVDLEGAVTRVEILAHDERRGKGIERRAFLTQFEGMTSSIEVMENITAVSGATISSRSACAAVTKAVVLCEEFCLKDTPEETEAPTETAPPPEADAPSQTGAAEESQPPAESTGE
jgi:Na+-translocating ferredoxin:NAD+ oxidoreductase RnfG subunit